MREKFNQEGKFEYFWFWPLQTRKHVCLELPEWTSHNNSTSDTSITCKICFYYNHKRLCLWKITSIHMYYINNAYFQYQWKVETKYMYVLWSSRRHLGILNIFLSRTMLTGLCWANIKSQIFWVPLNKKRFLFFHRPLHVICTL